MQITLELCRGEILAMARVLNARAAGQFHASLDAEICDLVLPRIVAQAALVGPVITVETAAVTRREHKGPAKSSRIFGMPHARVS